MAGLRHRIDEVMPRPGGFAMARLVRFWLGLLVFMASAAPASATDRAALLAEAATLAAALEGRALSEARFALAQTRAEIGDADAAEADAQAIPDDYMRAEALALVAAARAQSGDIAGAIATAERIEDAREQSARSAAFEAIAVAQALAGDASGAKATTGAIEDLYRRAEAQAAIARAQARSGDFDAALETARRIESTYWLADARARDAYRFSEVVIEDMWYFAALSAIAGIRAEAGDVTAARDLARSIRDGGWRARAVAAVALGLWLMMTGRQPTWMSRIGRARDTGSPALSGDAGWKPLRGSAYLSPWWS